MHLRKLDSTYLMRDKPAQDMQIVESEGSFVFDANGRKYIDFLSGWCVGNVGWGLNEIREPIRRYHRPEYVHPSYLYKPWAELARLLAEISPGNLKKCFRATGGTEAVEIALQVAMRYQKRKKFVSIEDAYHGNSIGTMSIGSSDNRDELPNPLPNCQKIPQPLDGKAADRVERILKKRDVAAFIMEPVIINLGVVVPEQEFMTRLRELCTRYDTLLIFDEVASGFGRTGKRFASQHFGVVPDVMCVSKAVTGGYAGLGAAIITQKVADAIGPFGVYSTYGWHPLGVDAALATIRYLMRNESKLLANVNALSGYFVERLSRMRFESEPEIRVKGLAVGLEFEDEHYPTELRAKCLRQGLLVSAEEDVLMLLPPLNIDEPTAKKGLDILEGCLSGGARGDRHGDSRNDAGDQASVRRARAGARSGDVAPRRAPVAAGGGNRRAAGRDRPRHDAHRHGRDVR